MGFLMILLALSGSLASGTSSVQTTWEGGPGCTGPVISWLDSFEACQDVSWLSVPGQLALGCSALSPPLVHFLADSVEHAYTVDTGDFNGDGYADILSGGNPPTGVCVWYGDGSGGWNMEIINADAEGLTGCDVADVNSDGHPDLLCATYFGKRIILYVNDGSAVPQWSEQVITDDFDGAHDVEASDIDGDGDPDILAAAAEDCRVTWWRNDGGSPIQWHEQDIDTDEEYPCRIQAVDLDEDGCMDVVASAWEGNRIVAWYGSGGGNPQWTEQLISSAVHGAHSVRAFDADGDGDSDLVVSAMSGSSLRLIRNCGGSPVQWNEEFLATQTACGYARPGDVDGDGDSDILSSSFGSGGAWWYENNGDGTEWTQHKFAGGLGSMPCALPADADGDGDLDALVTCMTTGNVLLCELTEFDTAGWLTGSILDTGGTPQWASIEWDAHSPAGTQIGVSYRTSDDPASMGDWSQTLYSPAELSGMVDRYFQYRIELQTSDQAVSPLVRDIRFNWDLTGIQGSPETEGFFLSSQCGNPIRRNFSVRISSGDATMSQLMLLDLAGRVVRSRTVFIDAGSSTLWQISGLPSGPYSLLASGEDGQSAILSFVVIR